jgi:hypothetical protein
MCLDNVSGCGGDPEVALRLRNAADYRLPTFGSHGTKLGHSWFQWLKKSVFSGWVDNSEKGIMFGHCRWMLGWSCHCTPPQERCRLSPTYFWTTWHQTRAILISVKNKKCFFSGWFDNSEKEDVFEHFECLRGWSCGCTPPQECCRLPPTYFWTTWHQTRSFLISVNSEKWSFWPVWRLWKRGYVWAFWAFAGLILQLHSASGMLQTTAYLLLNHMAPN